ncbi:MAG TPA: hypothetical protein VE174_09710 [Actinomycetota bacterium]|nr:hypothetical protein [Actinomycetota bacterium]
MSVGAVLVALAQAVLFVAIGWVLAEALFDRIGRPITLGAPERMLFAIVGGVVFACGLMVGNIVTGGAIFGLAGIVPVMGVIVLVSGRRSFAVPHNVPWMACVALACVVLFVFAAPSLAGGSGVRSGDSPWHLGWSQQLLNGEPVPTGPAAAYGRNAYPWGWHAVTATLVRLVPGSDALVAYEALQLIILLGIPLAAASLARRLDPNAGLPAAAAASIVGGFGWLMARRPAFATTPSDARYGADLVVASPNSVYELFPPALPRELGLILLGAACSLIVFAVRSQQKSHALAAGLCTGLLGLVSAPLFLSALIWMLAAFVFGDRKGRGNLPWALLPAAFVFLLWAGPVIADYIRFDGFVDITARLGREWSLPEAIFGWGLLAPAAAAGVVMIARDPRARPLLACLGGTMLLLLFSYARGAFDWTLGGNATLLHQGRVWPAAHLLGAAFAGVAIARGFAWMKQRSEVMSRVVMVLLFAIAVASPVLASLRLTEVIAAGHEGFIYGRSDVGPGSFVRESARLLGPDDIVRVQGSDRLAFTLFQFSGVKLADYDDPRFDRNDLRIRYEDLARQWDAQIAAGGFEETWLVLPDPDPSAGSPQVTGEFDGQTWSLVKV